MLGNLFNGWFKDVGQVLIELAFGVVRQVVIAKVDPTSANYIEKAALDKVVAVLRKAVDAAPLPFYVKSFLPDAALFQLAKQVDDLAESLLNKLVAELGRKRFEMGR